MNRFFLTYLALGILTFPCQGQSERIEDELLNCL